MSPRYANLATTLYQEKTYKGALAPFATMADEQTHETGFEYRIRSNYADCRSIGLGRAEAFEEVVNDLNSWADYWDNCSYDKQGKIQIARSVANTDSIESIINSTERSSCPNELADELLKLASESYSERSKMRLVEELARKYSHSTFPVFDEKFYGHIEKLHNNSRPCQRRNR